MYDLEIGRTYFFQYRDEAGNLSARVLRVEEKDSTSVTGYCYKRQAPRKLRYDRMYPPVLVSTEVAESELTNARSYPSYWPVNQPVNISYIGVLNGLVLSR